MKNKRKRKNKIKKKKNESSNSKIGLFLLLSFLIILGLFFETVKTLPAGAFSEKLQNMPYEIPSLNSSLIEAKLLKKDHYQNIKEKIIFEKVSNKQRKMHAKIKKIKKIENIEKDINNIQAQIEKVQTEIIEIETKELNEEITFSNTPKKDVDENEPKILVAKAPKTEAKEIESKIIDQTIVDVPKIEETIKIAADTSTKTITIEGEEKLIPGSSEKNITYMQILQKPNDLELNLKYAQQQGKAGNYKQTISTLERLNMLYPDNIEIKLYLLSVLVQADSPNKALTVIEEIKDNEDLTKEDLESVNLIEEEMKKRGKPKLWNFYADLGAGVVQSGNVNSVSKSRTQSSSDSVIGFNTAKYDRTLSGSFGLTATRAIGEASSFMINASHSESEQHKETGDDYESYGLTLAYDTALGNQSLSPYFMLSKTDYQTDADSFSLMYGIGGFFSVGDRNSFSYGYSYSDSKGNHNSSDTTANDTNAIGYSYTLGHDYMFNEIISASTGIGYSDSGAKDKTNDYETYDLNFRVNFAFPWAYISVGDAISFNDYKKVDTSTNSNRIRSDVTNTFDIMLTKAVGDLIPIIDKNKSLFFNLSYEKLISEANIINYDYIADSYSFSLSKSFHLNK